MSRQRSANIIHTESADWIAEKYRDLECRFKDLSGESIGARIEELPCGQSSSYHHYHTTEEEHVFMLTGEAVLVFGEQETVLVPGDHLWFRAGESVAHHMENRSSTVCTYLVYGERKQDDVVVYPEHQVMLIKALDNKQITYRPIEDK